MASIDSSHHPPRVSTVTACGFMAAAGGAVDILIFSRRSFKFIMSKVRVFQLFFRE